MLAWAGIPTREHEADRRAADLALVVDGFGSVGVRHVRARLARRRCEGWARRAVRAARAGRPAAAPGSTLALVAEHRDVDGALLDERTTAVELLNVLRPTVAVAWLITFAGMALLERPDRRDRLVVGSDAELLAFVDEVRRMPGGGGRDRADRPGRAPARRTELADPAAGPADLPAADAHPAAQRADPGAHASGVTSVGTGHAPHHHRGHAGEVLVDGGVLLT